MRKIIILFLTISLVLTSFCSAFAFDETETQKMAEEMEAQGLLSGVGKNEDGSTNFALRRAMTRQEAMVILVKLLGKFDEAASGTWENNFNDVDDWARPFVGYAYANGYTAGVAPDRFGAHNDVTASQYLTFVLKAMGYDASTDFDWRTAWIFTDNLGITAGEYSEENNKDFLRGDAIRTAYKAFGLGKSINKADTEELVGFASNEASSNTISEPKDLELPEGIASPLVEVPVEVSDGPEEKEYTGLDGIVEIARKYLGVPYLTAGKTPAGFDCSGFVIYVMKEYGLKFTAGCCQDLYELCEPVDPLDRKVGDIVFFKGTYSTDNMSHVGIYIGDGKMIHASSGYYGCITITEVMDNYWSKHFNSYGRMPLN